MRSLKPFVPVLAFVFIAVAHSAEPPQWANFVESNFPFYSSVLDARGIGRGLPENNLTPRGIILNPGADFHVCFDIDLLRVAAVWRGPGVTPVSMSQGSYDHSNWGKKAPEGQGTLPRAVGDLLYVNGLYPGVQIGDQPQLSDPRLPGPDPREIGRGPLPNAQFNAIQQTESGIVLEYTVAGIKIQDRFRAIDSKTPTLLRQLDFKPHNKPITVFHGFKVSNAPGLESAPLSSVAPPASAAAQHANGAAASSIKFYYGPTPDSPPPTLLDEAQLPDKRWVEVLKTHVDRVSTNDAYRVENIALPLDNPWRRNIRIADIAFFTNGRAAAITFDGDIWFIDGLNGELRDIRWSRFASGLHEPLDLVVKKNQIYVFDRNGIWRILDTDGNGEADRHELFCNRFAQSAETREFASSIKLAPDGSFIIAKPGQSISTIGLDSGKILRVSADGKYVTTLASGFRQPFVGVHPKTGLITASDQQGNYVPSTPLHIIRDNQYYGFRPVFLPPEDSTPTIAEPLVWFPHSINASGATQVWLSDHGMGPLNNTLIHVGFYRPELFNVLWNGGPNAAIVSFTRDLPFAALNAVVHPTDGSLFVTGFQIWGTTAPQISGLSRITYIGGESAIPREILPTREGILIQFNSAIVESSVRPENFSAERWNYRRSPEYGSPHFKLDGSKGQDPMFASSAYLSKDKHSVFVGFPDMQPVNQMRFGWSITSETGLAMQQNAYLTPRRLESFDPEKNGFGQIKIDLTPRAAGAAEATPVTVEEGRRLSELMGCVACHSIDGSSLGKVGPTWKGLSGSRVRFADGSSAVADADYLRESIRLPAAKIVKDFDKSDAGMPSYEGVLQDPQIEALILYIQSLR